jgi:hypothetical protein
MRLAGSNVTQWKSVGAFARYNPTVKRGLAFPPALALARLFLEKPMPWR